MQSSQYVFPLPPIRRLATRSVTFIPASPTSVVSFSLRFAWSRRGVTILDPIGALFARRFHYSGELMHALRILLRPPLRRFAVCQFVEASKVVATIRVGGALSGPLPRGPENFHNWTDTVSLGGLCRDSLAWCAWCCRLRSAGAPER